MSRATAQGVRRRREDEEAVDVGVVVGKTG